MTESQLTALGIDAKWLEPLNKTFDEFHIDNPKRQAAFIGQCAHESGNFKLLQENLNYSAKALQATWPSRFTSEKAAECERKPELIANVVYGGRMGNTEPGDGWKYHGRGLIQLTGKDNYVHFNRDTGVDCVNNPDLLCTPEFAALSAGWFWSTHGLNQIADTSDWVAITKKINGGTLGLDDRVAKTNKALDILGS
jgi:putative chitinase